MPACWNTSKTWVAAQCCRHGYRVDEENVRKSLRPKQLLKAKLLPTIRLAIC
ncbi:hypothetical protein ACF3DV_33645 (plasmid) [Chlorogloeopsis fritschii PCC 9212]|uniref:hypothetical protein n=1 Tax=Chlorogloeopsis fritschii TaxID=1124 RepID=UPI0002E41B1E|nr:hypothetical protein [Chlorogloeopsis fritschii]